jgi:hypothetical protein
MVTDDSLGLRPCLPRRPPLIVLSSSALSHEYTTIANPPCVSSTLDRLCIPQGNINETGEISNGLISVCRLLVITNSPERSGSEIGLLGAFRLHIVCEAGSVTVTVSTGLLGLAVAGRCSLGTRLSFVSSHAVFLALDLLS